MPRAEYVDELLTRDTRSAVGAHAGESKRHCPVCDGEMTRYSSWGHAIDVCAQHGIWLEKGELVRILESFAENERATDLAAEARQQGRYEGIFGGWFSLLLP